MAARLQTTEPVSPSPALRASVLAAIADVPQEPGEPQLAPSAAVPIRSRWRHRVPALAAAAAVVLIAGGGLVAVTRDGSTTEDPVAAVVDADDVTTRTLEGTLQGTLAVMYSPSEGAMVLLGDEVPAVPDDQTYQLWMVDDAGPSSAGTFRPDERGHVELWIDLDPTASVVAVTLETAGGSEQPTLPMLASA